MGRHTYVPKHCEDFDELLEHPHPTTKEFQRLLGEQDLTKEVPIEIIKRFAESTHVSYASPEYVLQLISELPCIFLTKLALAEVFDKAKQNLKNLAKKKVAKAPIAEVFKTEEEAVTSEISKDDEDYVPSETERPRGQRQSERLATRRGRKRKFLSRRLRRSKRAQISQRTSRTR